MSYQITARQQKVIDSINTHEKWEVTKINDENDNILFIEVETIEKHMLIEEKYMFQVGKQGSLKCLCAFGSPYATKASKKVSVSLFGHDINRKIRYRARG